MSEHVVVLMSTYNGTTYLKEQLDSIFDQDYSGKITTVIRDDGSKDETEQLVAAYPQREDRCITWIQGENLGPQRSFLALIDVAPKADFYFFADQDDVWDAQKIRSGVEAMKVHGNTPVCYCSNYRLSDMDLQVYEETAIKETPRFTPLRVLFYNQIPGCAMGFSWALMEKLQQLKLKNVMMHDSMALSFAALIGETIYDPQPRIIHRIHRDNVVGDGHKKIIPHKWIAEKWKLFFKKEPYDVSEMAEAFLRVGGDLVHPKYREDMVLLRDFKKSRRITRKLLSHPDSKGPFLDRTVLSIRCKIRFGIF